MLIAILIVSILNLLIVGLIYSVLAPIVKIVLSILNIKQLQEQVKPENKPKGE